VSKRRQRNESYDNKSGLRKKIAAYLASEISHEELLKWVDAALVKEDFPEKDGRTLLGVLSDLSAGRTSGYLSQIESYQAMLHELGFRMEIIIPLTVLNTKENTMYKLSLSTVSNWQSWKNMWVPVSVDTLCPLCGRLANFPLEKHQHDQQRNTVSASGRCPGCGKNAHFWVIEPGDGRDSSKRGCACLLI
jgi:hypothetical protein